MAKSRHNRSGQRRLVDATRQPSAERGPKVSHNVGARVSDGAGTRSQAALPPETLGMKAPTHAHKPEVTEMKSKTMAVPSAETPLIGVVTPWDYARDSKAGRDTRPKGDGC